MKIVGHNPLKKGGRALLQETRDGIKYFATGNRCGGESLFEFKFNPIFELSIKPTGFSRGRSSVVQVFRDPDDIKYIMAADATSKLLQSIVEGKHTINHETGEIFGLFCTIKQGSSISLYPFTDDFTRTA